MCEFTVDNPENNCYWRLMDENEQDIFLHYPDEFGFTAQEALSSGCRALAQSNLLKGQKGALMGCYQKYVMQWRIAKNGVLKLLCINKDYLDANSLEALDNAHVAVTSELLIESGQLFDIAG